MTSFFGYYFALTWFLKLFLKKFLKMILKNDEGEKRKKCACGVIFQHKSVSTRFFCLHLQSID